MKGSRVNARLSQNFEMIFEAEEFGEKMNLVPFYWRNDYAGIEQYSAFTEGGRTFLIAKLRREHIAFAGTCDGNLKAQGFLETRESMGRRKERRGARLSLPAERLHTFTREIFYSKNDAIMLKKRPSEGSAPLLFA
jgi:hypothetical protein